MVGRRKVEEDEIGKEKTHAYLSIINQKQIVVELLA